MSEKVIVKGVNINCCRICMDTKKNMCPLFKYQFAGNYAEMLTAVADVKVSNNDGLPEKICSKCCTALEKAFSLKTAAERADKKFRKQLEKYRNKIPKKKIAFDSLKDIKTEINHLNVKLEPKVEFDMELLNSEVLKAQNEDIKDLVIANTVIRKVECTEETKPVIFDDNEAVDVSWKKVKTESSNVDKFFEDAEYLDDAFFDDNDNDEDYKPPVVEKKPKFKKPKVIPLSKVTRRVKVVKQNVRKPPDEADCTDGEKTGSLITCYPVTQNGAKGAPILLRRPKDSTVLKVNSNYRSATTKTVVVRCNVKTKPIKIIKGTKTNVMKHSKEKLVCPVCGILTHNLGNHMSTHQEKKKYNCPQCPKSFSQKGNMLSHLKHHTGVKDHICEICGAGFYHQKGLIRHNLIHKGDRPYGCSLCPKRFIARCDLNRHLRIHSGYKPYKCNNCTMSFNAKHQLQNHERMHTGERPYSCQVCNVAFSYKVNLNNHVYKVHGINLKFKSIHIVTEDVLRQEMEMTAEPRNNMSHLLPPPPQLTAAPHHGDELIC